MPEKSRCSVSPLGIDSSRRDDFLQIIKTWDSSCQREQDNVILDPPATERVSDHSEVTWVSNSEWINYTNSLYRRFNPCDHIEVVSGTSGSGLLSLRKLSQFTEERPFNGCGDQDWLSRYVLARTELTLNVSNTFLEEVVPQSIVMIDPYLDQASGAYRDKLDELDQMALLQMIPRLDAGWSLPRFLVELVELKQLWSSILGILRGILKLAGYTVYQLKRWLKSLFGRKTVNELSDAYLASIFGALPLVSDIKEIIRRLFTMRSDIERFMANRNKTLTYHYEKKLSPLTFRDAGWFLSEGSFSLETENPHDNFHFARDHFRNMRLGTQTKRKVNRLSYHATMDFSYNIGDNIPESLMRFYAALDHWGVNLSISDVWELIPFSFVVDWVWNVGSIVQRLDLTNLPIQVVVYDFCRSFRYDLEETIRITGVEEICLDSTTPDNLLLWDLTAPANGVVFQSNTTSYHRMVGIPRPSEEVLPNLTFPSGMRWVTASALVLQRRRR